MNKIQFCPMCKKEDEKVGISYAQGFLLDEDELYEICPDCGYKELITYNISNEDVTTICDISKDPTFLEAMINLKETDIIEYESRMSQFRSQVEQQEQTKQKAEENSKPHCPHCNSTNIKSISGLNRGASIAMWGIFSKKINKSFECKNCGYTW